MIQWFHVKVSTEHYRTTGKINDDQKGEVIGLGKAGRESVKGTWRRSGTGKASNWDDG